MDYWDDTVSVSTITTKKEIWRVELFGDLDGNFRFVAHVDKVQFDGGEEIGRIHLDDVVTDFATAEADPALEPSMTKLRNGCRALIRALRTA
jgi:hypothetical protein